MNFQRRVWHNRGKLITIWLEFHLEAKFQYINEKSSNGKLMEYMGLTLSSALSLIRFWDILEVGDYQLIRVQVVELQACLLTRKYCFNSVIESSEYILYQWMFQMNIRLVCKIFMQFGHFRGETLEVSLMKEVQWIITSGNWYYGSCLLLTFLERSSGLVSDWYCQRFCNSLQRPISFKAGLCPYGEG